MYDLYMPDSTPDETSSDTTQPLNSESETITDKEQFSDEIVSSLGLPESIGNYRILSLLGEGGMGSVYKAEQDSPRRIVALKVIKAGVASKNLLTRFEIEAQILGRLDHPGIATIFEAGTFDEGNGKQPYFAMEFVNGQLLTTYAESRKLGTRERLELLSKIADAVQHAHQKGVIHRDLKPGNILVTESGQVKILDFGVARATDSDIQSATLHTDIGQLVGTIPYMSPEQASGDPDELDTRSDIYALGIVGYELLTGKLPYDVSRKLIHEAVRIIREDVPRPLSSINRLYRGDIEIIVSKALSKEKERRYQSASDFSSDIQHYLNNEPVIARAPSVWYQVRKFSRRNRAIVVSAILIVLVSLVGGLVSARFAYLESLQAKIAKENERIASVARDQAVVQKDIAQAVNSVLNDHVLALAAPDETGTAKRGNNLTVREALESAAESLGETTSEYPPIVVSAVQLTIGQALLTIGVPERAEEHLRRAIELLDEIDPSIFDIQSRKEQRALIQLRLSESLFRQGNVEEALDLSLDSTSLLKKLLSQDSELLASALHEHANVLKWNGRLDEAISLYQELLGARKLLSGSNDDMVVSDLHYNLALALERTGDVGQFAKAVAMMELAYETRKHLHGPDAIRTLNTQAELGRMIRNDEPQRAIELYTEALEGMRKIRSDEHWRNRQTAVNLALMLSKHGDLERAIDMMLAALDGYRQWSGPTAGDTLAVTGFTARLLSSHNRLIEADRVLDEAKLLIDEEGLTEEEIRTAKEKIDSVRDSIEPAADEP